jgi:hypothetical protein
VREIFRSPEGHYRVMVVTRHGVQGGSACREGGGRGARGDGCQFAPRLTSPGASPKTARSRSPNAPSSRASSERRS